MSNETLVQIDAPHFCAGLVFCAKRVTEAAPILRYMVGWPSTKVAAYAAAKGWKVTYKSAQGWRKF